MKDFFQIRYSHSILSLPIQKKNRRIDDHKYIENKTKTTTPYPTSALSPGTTHSLSLTFTPFALQLINVRLCFASSVRSQFCSAEKRCSSRTVTYEASVKANCWPMQIRGPPLNYNIHSLALTFYLRKRSNSISNRSKKEISQVLLSERHSQARIPIPLSFPPTSPA